MTAPDLERRIDRKLEVAFDRNRRRLQPAEEVEAAK